MAWQQSTARRERRMYRWSRKCFIAHAVGQLADILLRIENGEGSACRNEKRIAGGILDSSVQEKLKFVALPHYCNEEEKFRT
jgi:hypothetical protein